MNTLIKLLTEEPLKLERLILLFLKFIVTLGMIEVLFSCGPLIDQVIHEEFEFRYSTGELIKYISIFIVFWFVIWWIIAEMFLGGTVKLLSRLFKPERGIREILEFLDWIIFKPAGKKHINYAIIKFEDFLNASEADEEIPASDIRIDKYFEIYAITTLFFLLSDSAYLSGWLTAAWWLIGLFLVFGYIVAHRIVQFFNSQFNDLKVEAHKSAYIERTRLAISNIQHFVKSFEIKHKTRNIRLEIKVADTFEERIRIIPIYASNSPILQEMAANELKRMASRKPKDYLSVIVTNVPINVTEATLRHANSTIIVAQDETEMKEGLEIIFSLYLKQIHGLSLLEKTPDTNS